MKFVTTRSLKVYLKDSVLIITKTNIPETPYCVVTIDIGREPQVAHLDDFLINEMYGISHHQLNIFK